MLSFKPTFSLSTFTFIKRLFSSSLLYAIRVVSSASSACTHMVRNRWPGGQLGTGMAEGTEVVMVVGMRWGWIQQ